MIKRTLLYVLLFISNFLLKWTISIILRKIAYKLIFSNKRTYIWWGNGTSGGMLCAVTTRSHSKFRTIWEWKEGYSWQRYLRSLVSLMFPTIRLTWSAAMVLAAAVVVLLVVTTRSHSKYWTIWEWKEGYSWQRYLRLFVSLMFPKTKLTWSAVLVLVEVVHVLLVAITRSITNIVIKTQSFEMYPIIICGILNN